MVDQTKAYQLLVAHGGAFAFLFLYFVTTWVNVVLKRATVLSPPLQGHHVKGPVFSLQCIGDWSEGILSFLAGDQSLCL